MKAWVVHSKIEKASLFTPDILKLEKDYPLPPVEDGKLVVKVHACGLNPVDYKLAAFARKFPFVPGCDIAGTVHKVGTNVVGFKEGDRVYFHGDIQSTYGGYCDYTLINAKTVSHIPEGVSFIDAAALPTASWTAWVALHDKLRVRSGETILVTAASGGVGGYVVQLAKLSGLTVIGTCSSKNASYVKKLGADHVIDYNTEDIMGRVKELTNGRGIDIWIDMLGSDSADLGLKCLAFGGSLVVVQGNPTTPLGDLFAKQVSVHEVFLGAAHGADEKYQMHFAEMGNSIIKLVNEKKTGSNG